MDGRHLSGGSRASLLGRDRELRALEMFRGGPGSSESADGGPGGRLLTAQEHRVAVLASLGRTNKDIAHELLISPRTVGAHLNHVFIKLDVSSRAGLHR